MLIYLFIIYVLFVLFIYLFYFSILFIYFHFILSNFIFYLFILFFTINSTNEPIGDKNRSRLALNRMGAGLGKGEKVYKCSEQGADK
jgi:hypothetical protein